jgi:hypothetical protein
MNSRIKQYMLIAVLAAAGYFIMNNHIIFLRQRCPSAKEIFSPSALHFLQHKAKKT